MKTYDTLFACLLLAMFTFFFIGLFLLRKSDKKQRAFEALGNIGRQFANNHSILSCSIKESPVQMSFRSCLMIDEILTEFRLHSERVGYEFDFVSYNLHQSLFYIGDKKTKMRFIIQQLSVSEDPNDKNLFKVLLC